MQMHYSYQLIKDDFPAEWFPMSIMVIFLRGAKSFKSKLEAIWNQKKV